MKELVGGLCFWWVSAAPRLWQRGGGGEGCCSGGRTRGGGGGESAVERRRLGSGMDGQAGLDGGVEGPVEGPPSRQRTSARHFPHPPPRRASAHGYDRHPATQHHGLWGIDELERIVVVVLAHHGALGRRAGRVWPERAAVALAVVVAVGERLGKRRRRRGCALGMGVRERHRPHCAVLDVEHHLRADRVTRA